MAVILDSVVPADGTYTFDVFTSLKHKAYALMQARLIYGSGGTSIKVFLQTSIDEAPGGPVTWRDVACLAFLVASANKASAVNAMVAAAPALAATDGTLADDTIVQGVIGDKWRVKVITLGTYAGGSNLRVDVDLEDYV